MKKLLLLFLVSTTMLFTNCEPKEVESVQAETVCNCQQRDKVADFIQNSIKNANNMSDEEMEDVIRELRHTAVNIYCPKKNIKAIRRQSGYIERLVEPLDSCEQIMEGY
jgi:hypothetical protein